VNDLPVFVTKADGSRQLFDREKVVKTCLRMGANRRIAFEVADEVEARLYDGIPTRTVLQMIFRLLRKHKSTIRHFLDLKKGLSLMNSKPEFEKFVQILLSHHGFEVSPNQIIRGKCVGHEVDAIARKDGITYFVEAKHHSNYHTPTGLDESRIARAVLEDVTEGFVLGKNDLKIDRAMIVTNTRYSEHARRYGKCRNMLQIGWSSPKTLGLQNMIEEKKLYPLSCIKGLNNETKMKLVNSGIVLMKQLVEEEPSKLARETGISREILKKIIEKAKTSTYLVNKIN
jgi:Holliday junction resolvase-like predicted endonuclease